MGLRRQNFRLVFHHKQLFAAGGVRGRINILGSSAFAVIIRTGFRANDKAVGASCSTIALKAGYLLRTVPCSFLNSMAEDHVLVLAPKSFASKLGKREGKIGVLNNDVSFDVDAGV